MHRDDLFTHIHKALRKGLFEITVAVGAADWDDPVELRDLAAEWHALLALFHSHTLHEDNHILRVLDPYEPAATERAREEHRDLDGLLEHLAARFDTLFDAPDPVTGLEIYRDLARFVAAYLPHLHDEETTVMDRIWARCSDQEIAATRAAFMAEVTPEEQELSMRLMLPAVDRRTRLDLARTVAATAPASAVQALLDIADQTLPNDSALELRHAVAPLIAS